MRKSDEAAPLVGDGKKSVGLFSLLVIAFFWVSGGMYGNEELLQAGPPGLVFLLLLLTPIFYSFPISLVSIELSSALPMEGGAVAWIQEACGKALGGHNTYWICFGYLVDSAIYPVLASEYVYENLGSAQPKDTSRETVVSLISMGFIGFVTIIKLLGTSLLVQFASVMALASLLPAVIYVLSGIDHLEPKDWDSFDNQGDAIDWNLLLSWQIWLYSGFFGIGALTAEIDNAYRKIIQAIAILMPLLILMNCLPLLVSLGYDNNLENYYAGYFDYLAEEHVGKWLSWMITIGSQVAMIGLYNSQTVICERSISSFVASRVGRPSFGIYQSQWKHFLFDDSYTGVGRIYILFTALAGMLFVWIPYDVLVELSAFFFSITLFFFFYTFLYFKWKQPSLPRPFAVPGNIIGAMILSIFPMFLTAVNFYYSAADDTPVRGVPYFKVLVLDFVILFGIVVHFFYAYRVPILGVCGVQLSSQNVDSTFLVENPNESTV